MPHYRQPFLLLGVLVAVGTLNSAPALAVEPQFYPNETYNSTPVSKLQSDITQCKQEASKFVGSESGTALKGGARSAARGAALGAMAGAITKQNVGRSAGAGAAIGGTVGAVGGARSKGANNPEFQKYASVCLEEKGYKVVAWR